MAEQDQNGESWFAKHHVEEDDRSKTEKAGLYYFRM